MKSRTGWVAVPLVFLQSSAAYAQTGCKETTLREELAENQSNIFKSALGAAGSGLVLFAVRKGEPTVVIGSFLLFNKEFSDFANAVWERKQFNGLDPEAKLKSCPAGGALAATLGFKDLTILKPATIPPVKALPSFEDIVPGVDDSAVQRMLDRLHKAPPPIVLTPKERDREMPPPAPPRSVSRLPEWRSAVPASVTGNVLEGNSGLPVEGAYVRFVHSSYGDLVSSITLTGNQGTFAIDYMPPGQYVLSIVQPGYSSYSQEVDVPGNFVVRLNRQPSYPCTFTVFNRTSWTVQVWPSGEQSVLIQPYLSETRTLIHADQFYARADFFDHQPANWGPIPVQCGGTPFIEIVP